ncbi:hypothetical protein OROGR_031595 [Orobanche gracilis]
MGTAEKCESIPDLGDSSQSAGGEAVSLEGKTTEAGGGEEALLENHAAEGETRFVVDSAVAEINESLEVDTAVTEEGGGEMIGPQSVDPPRKMKAEEESNRVDGAELVAVVVATGDALMFTESKVGEMLVDQNFETKSVEEFALSVDAKLEMVVIDSETQNEMAAVDEFSPVIVDSKMDAVVTDISETQHLCESPMDARGDDLQVVMEGTEALDNESEGEMSDGNNNKTHYETVDNLVVESNAEAVVEVDKVGEEKVGAFINDSEVGTTEKPVGIEEEKVDTVITEELPITGVEMDVQMTAEVDELVVNTDEQEQVHAICKHAEDKDVSVGESLMSDTELAEDESTNMEVLGGSLLDEPVNMTQNRDSMVKDDCQAGDIEAKSEKGAELEFIRNVVVDDTQLDDADNLKGTELVADKTPDDNDGKMETEETNSDADDRGHELYDSPSLEEEEDETLVAEEETGTQDTEMETETDITEPGKTSPGKRKRGKSLISPSISKTTTKASSRNTVGEDVCFICFDGGELVLCDRRGCPKAYHPSCVNRDEAFFKSKGRWNCGWHLCSICEKNARYMCFTCTFSLCKSCIKDAVFSCVRGNKGFCDACMRTVELIENIEQGNKNTQIDFDDRSSWEYLFKDYYIELKAKHSLSSVEIAEAKNPWKGAGMLSGPGKEESFEAPIDANDGGSASDDSIENRETIRPKRRKIRKKPKPLSGEEGDKAISVSDNYEWASKELLEFVSHMKDGDTSLLSQFDVQALLLEYIKRNKLRDRHRKSQIVCDGRLENLFGKPRVAHFEMLKLLESHFLVRDEHTDDCQGSVVDTENNQLGIDGNTDQGTRGVKDRKRKTRKKSEPQSNLDDYAAIDMQNIGLIYLRRKLMEDLLEDAEMFHDKVVGTFVRIRISGSNQKQDLYRLVPVIGTSKAADPYKIGKKSTDTMVEILNLDKTEIISIDTISNQEFTEEECKRLRQSIKCGLIRRLIVGEILDKAMEIQVARVNDWLESEILRLSHLRDRASDLGRRKDCGEKWEILSNIPLFLLQYALLRECVEKLQLLKTPEERRRRLDEIPEIHADPKMDPSYESDDNDSENEDSRRDAFMRSKGFSRRGRGPISPGNDNLAKVSSKNWESNKYSSGGGFSINASHVGEIVNESSWNLESDKLLEESSNSKKLNSGTNFGSGERAPYSAPRPESISDVASVTPSQASLPAGPIETAVKINESEKIWHYKDPSGKVQGPFSLVQLRKWNNTGYFPTDLGIWRATEKQDNSILLADALEGKFPTNPPAVDNIIPATNSAIHISHQDKERVLNKLPAEKWHGSDTTNLPSPTPRQSKKSGWDVEERRCVLTGAIHQTPPGGVNGTLASPTPILPNVGTHSSSAAASSVMNPAIQTAPFSPTPNSQQGIQMNPTVSLHAQPSTTSEPSSVQMHAHPLVIGQNPQGYGSGAASAHSSSGNFSNLGTPDAWRHGQTNMTSPATPDAAWGMWPAENSNLAGGVGPKNPNMGWGTVQGSGPSHNMAWGSWGPSPLQVPIPGNTPNWVAPSGNNVGPPMTGYVNPGWVGPPVQGPGGGNGWAPPPSGNAGAPPGPPPSVQGPQQGTMYPGFAPPPSVQGPQQGTMYPGFAPPPSVQGPQQGTMYPGFAPSGNQGGSWGGGGDERNQMAGQFSGQRGRRGRDSGFRGGPRPWNNQSSFEGGGFRKCDTVCPYNAKGRCRKGAECDYIHT